MKLERLSLRNFRQFRDADIEFSRNQNKNVTVIHGQNGSGKTTILNAFLWVLFEELQSIKKPERIATQGEMVAADVGDTVTVEVELIFDHEGSRHEVRRRKSLQKQSSDDLEGMEVDGSFVVEKITEDGNVDEPTNPESYVRQIVPDDLAELFFFDGEYISDLSGVDNQDEIQDAIRQMMGLTLMERSIKHLDWVEGQFRDELKDLGSEELQSLIQERDEVESEKEARERELKDKTRERDRLQEEIGTINELLTQVGETRELQEDREELESDRDELEDDVDEINDDLDSLISDKGFLTFAMPAIKETAASLDDLREQGKIPSRLDNEFIDELVEQGECICGRPLDEESPECEAVLSHKSDVTSDGLDQASIRLIDKLDRIRSERDGFFEKVDRLLKRRSNLDEDIEELSGQIDDISTKIQDLGQGVDDLDTDEVSLDELDLDAVESVSDLEAARNAKDDKLSNEIKPDITLLEKEIEEYKDDISELEDKIDEAEDEQQEADLARKRMQVAKAVREELELYYEQFQQSIRERADEKIDQTFEKVATKGYEAVITDDFELRIHDRQHGTPIEVDKSRGERQIASLSFIGSLVDIAREQYEADRDTDYFDGGIYPIVMDSPFGALDNEHRGEVSEVLPMLADQVIVLVTDSQWEGPVEERMGPHVGVHYDLDFDENGGIEGSPITDVTEVSRHKEVAD